MAEKVTKEEEQEILDSMKESSEKPKSEDNPAEIRSLSVHKEPAALATKGSLDIEGLEDVPASMLAVPFVKIVQFSSTKTVLESGVDADPGNFFFTDLQTQEKELKFVMLRAKPQIREFDDDKSPTGKRMVRQVLVLGMILESQKLFILILPVSSFSSWGKLLSKLKENKVLSVWESELVASTELQKNDKGKFYVANFQIGRELDDDEIGRMAATYGQYGGVLERQDVPEPDPSEI